MAEMVERVARAIYEASTLVMGDDAPDDWADIGPDHDKARAEWAKLARAAIEAMREPTNEMTVVGWKFAETRDAILGNGEIDALWRAMIDAALAEGEGR